MTDELLAIADDLYALPLGDFTPARDAKAKELKGTDLAAPVKALKKPSLAAWVVNLLVRRDAEQVEQVLASGRRCATPRPGWTATSSAPDPPATPADGRGHDRARGARRASGGQGHPGRGRPGRGTLTAAMVDARCAEAVRSGLLVAALASTGVDEVDLSAAVATPEALGFTASPGRAADRPTCTSSPTRTPTRRRVAAAQERLEDAVAAARPRRPGARRPRPRPSTELEARTHAAPGRDRRAAAQAGRARDGVRGGRRGARRRRGRPLRGRGRAGRRRLATGTRPPQKALAKLSGGLARQTVAQPLDRRDRLQPAAVGGVGVVRSAAGSNRRSRDQVSRSSSVEAQTPVPRPARNAAPRAVVSTISGRSTGHAELVGLDLAQQVVGGGAAVDPERGQPGHRLEHVAHLERDRLERGAHDVRAGRAAGEADEQAAGVRVPVRGAEPGQRGHEHHAVGVVDGRRRAAAVSAADPTICSPSRSHCTAAPVTKIAPSSA